MRVSKNIADSLFRSTIMGGVESSVCRMIVSAADGDDTPGVPDCAYCYMTPYAVRGWWTSNHRLSLRPRS
jgi:hypothetical protein